MDKKIYLALATDEAMTNLTLSGIERPEIIKINYGKGNFTINLCNALEAWTISDFKKYNSILLMSNDPYNTAEKIHAFLVKTVKHLEKQKADKIGNAFINEREKISVYINRLVKFNDVLVDSYGIETIEAETKPKYKKCDVYAMIRNNDGIKEIKVFPGYEFNYHGFVFQVYKQKNSRYKYIILPSTGISCGQFSSGIKTAHEFLKPFLDGIEKENSKNIISDIEKQFIDLMNEFNYEIPASCTPLYYGIDTAENIADNSINNTATGTAKDTTIKANNAKNSHIIIVYRDSIKKAIKKRIRANDKAGKSIYNDSVYPYKIGCKYLVNVADYVGKYGDASNCKYSLENGIINISIHSYFDTS